ncbi:putative amino acid permease YhdG [Phycisphaerae bacterium RAS1]|nr:putative amino acid permease YhdG [Phycisphaerae bacterium RAS1]
MLAALFRSKSVDQILAAPEEGGHALRRSLGAWDVTLLGVGAIIGAGIFSTIGTATAGDSARPGAGPSLMLSFVITAVACGLTALCYAEFASTVPISGSAYTYAYATFGELIAWIIGWDLIIEYAVGNVAVAISWAGYFNTLLGSVGVHLPEWLTTDFRSGAGVATIRDAAPHIYGVPIIFNALAAAIVLAITGVLVIGVRESASFNAVMVIFKILILLFFVAAACSIVSPAKMAENWQPFQPNGWKGTLSAAAVIFFAYIGFDAVSTVAEETRRPARDMPIGIFASLGICTVLYILVAAVFTGLIPYEELIKRMGNEQAEPLTMALDHVAPQLTWVRTLVALGSVVAMTAVLLVFQLGQPRIFFSMARDGMLPPLFARVHARFRTPHVTTLITGVLVAAFAAFARIDEMVDLTNIGTLFAFVLVCLGIPILRLRDPDRVRPFRVPLGAWLIPLLGAASCVGLIVYLPPASWWRFAAWLMIGLGVYAGYGFTRSRLNAARDKMLPPVLLVSAMAFLAAAWGMLTLPHDAMPLVLLERLATDWRSAGAAPWLALGGTVIGLLLFFIGGRGVRRDLRP